MKKIAIMIGIILLGVLSVVCFAGTLNPYGYPANWGAGIAAGEIHGQSIVNISGYNGSVATTETTSEIWNTTGAYIYLTTASTLAVTSASVQDGYNIWLTGGSTLEITSTSTFDTQSITISGITSEVYPTTRVTTIDTTGTTPVYGTLDYLKVTGITAVTTAAAGTISVSGVTISGNPTVGAIAIGATAGTLTLGTGMRTIKIEGLNSAWGITSETISAKGTTVAWTSYPFIRVFKSSLVTAGSGNVNAGAISIKDNTATSTLDSITTGKNVSQSARYTIPTGYTGYIMGYSLNSSGAADITLRTKYGANTPITGNQVYNVLAAGAPILIHNFAVPVKVPAQYDIYFNIDSVATASTKISGGLQLMLVTN